MTPPRSGSAQTSEFVLGVAQELAETLSDPAEVLVGVTLAGSTMNRRAVLDLVVITERAAFVGIDARPDDACHVTPRRAANLLVGSLQQGSALTQPLPVYAFWLGHVAQEGVEANVPALPDAGAVRQYMLEATADRPHVPGNAPRVVAERLLEQDGGTAEGRSSVSSRLRWGLRNLARLPRSIDAGLQEQIRQPRILRRRRPILPADVNGHLAKAMLARRNILEDADYCRIVPNDYLVELNEVNYMHNYAPIEAQVCERWQVNLQETLDTTNERWGRQAYKLGGHVRIRIKPTPDLALGSVRVQATIDPDVEARPAPASTVYLESVSDRRRWPLQDERTTIGRDRGCDVWLDMATVQEARLVSGCHAHICYQDRAYHLFDGTPEGKRSANGSFVNGQPLGPAGRKLEDGDVILLASLDPERPRLDTPGVVALSFHASARERA